ncbi:MAG TPA: hypothetical protein VGO71_21660 [Baekduia sp.]|jgi:hypothetical protein|nr:hypothetical protein [Baekduia sp.]
MSQLLAVIVLVGLVAFTIFSVVTGTWYGTWCASGKPDRGPQFPGGPRSDR